MGKESPPNGASALPADPIRGPSSAREEQLAPPGLGAPQCTRDEVEQLVELDLSLVPDRPSALLVEPSVLDPEEVRALLADLGSLLAGAAHPPTLPAAPIGT